MSDEMPHHTPPAHEDYFLVLRDESERLLATLDGVDLRAPVPTCAGWTAADLLRHVGGVQQGCAAVAEGHEGDDFPEPTPPADDDDLAAYVAVAGTALLTALRARPASTPAWSWHPDGGTLAWLARRQAHEVLIHRVDAELTAGVPVTPPVHEIAADGVDEVLRTYAGGVLARSASAADGARLHLETTNEPERSWQLDLGSVTGTSGRPTSIRGSAWDLDLWLWGRGPLEALAVDGDPALAVRLRALVAAATG